MAVQLVHSCTTADGTMVFMSDKYVTSVVKNGSSYDTDKGVDPHYYINKPEKFYDIEGLSRMCGE